LLAVVERRPGVPLRSAAHICQPCAAFVLTEALIALDSVGLLVNNVPRAAVVADRENEKLALTLALTWIWSQAWEPLPQLLPTLAVA
jgi:hypothetical protein